jgi:fatty acid desaturase
MTRRVWFDLILVYAFLVGLLLVCTNLSLSLNGDGNVWAAFTSAFVFAFLVPFLLWNSFISFLSIVQHTGEDVRWVMPTGRASTVEQTMAGTVHVVFPEWLDRLLHRIMQHQAHHISVAIPLQQLKEAQAVVRETSGNRLVHAWTPSYHWRLTQNCQLYDHVTNRWCRFEDAA